MILKILLFILIFINAVLSYDAQEHNVTIGSNLGVPDATQLKQLDNIRSYVGMNKYIHWISTKEEFATVKKQIADFKASGDHYFVLHLLEDISCPAHAIEYDTYNKEHHDNFDSIGTYYGITAAEVDAPAMTGNLFDNIWKVHTLAAKVGEGCKVANMDRCSRSDAVALMRLSTGLCKQYLITIDRSTIKPVDVSRFKFTNIKKVTLKDIGNYLDQVVKVEFTVMSAFKSDKVMLLNSNTNFKDKDNFQVVIFDFSKFKTADDYKGNTISVTGMVVEYKGKLEIIVNAPEYLKVIGGDK